PSVLSGGLCATWLPWLCSPSPQRACTVRVNTRIKLRVPRVPERTGFWKCGTPSETSSSPWLRVSPKTNTDFKLQKDERIFAQTTVAAIDYDLLRCVSGSDIGPDFGKNKHNPSQDVYKTQADVVKLMQQAVDEGAGLIQQQGDGGLDKTTKFARGNKL